MIKLSKALGICMLISAVVAQAAPAVKTVKAPAKTAKSGEKLFNLKHFERRIEAHAKKLERRGQSEQPSEAFKAVQEGMKNGKYHYDRETASAVAREVNAHRAPRISSLLLDGSIQ